MTSPDGFPHALADDVDTERTLIGQLRTRVAELESHVTELDKREERAKREAASFRKWDEIYMPACRV